MGCSVCGAASAPNKPAKSKISAPIVENPNCEYTLQMMQDWRLLLLCVRQNNLYDEVQINKAENNSALGIVISAINTGGNTCRFEQHLNNIRPAILRIINSGKCEI